MSRLIATALLLICSSVNAAPEALVRASPRACVQGLYQQPNGGPFSVFLFCDDAGGVNIGVINTSGGAGPGRIELGPTKEWSKWRVNDRFWQEPAWATDITSFAWSPDLKSLYVGTSEIYGTGALYKLDLVARKFAILIPDCRSSSKRACSTEIVDIDRGTGIISVEVGSFDEASRKTEMKRLKVK